MANEEEIKTAILVSDNWNNIEGIFDFYLNETFSDITLLIEKERIPAHKIILTTRCKYFKNILSNNSQESELRLENVSTTTFLNILKYIYTGSISIIPTNEELLIEVLKVSHEYLLDGLAAAVCEQMMSVTSISNVCSLLNGANLHGVNELRTVCHNFIDEHILEVQKSDYYHNLSQASMVGLLERDNLPLAEIDVFNMVAEWCKINKDTDNLVVQCVRLTLLTRTQILSAVRPSKLIESDTLLNVLASIEYGIAVKRERKKPPPIKKKLVRTRTGQWTKNINLRLTCDDDWDYVS